MKDIVYIVLILLVLLLLFLLLKAKKKPDFLPEKPKKEPLAEAAGKRGEQYAKNKIREVLEEGDHLLNNVFVSFERQRTELDNVIVNRNGVFIIEVKNHTGTLTGSERDPFWIKHHVSRNGHTYTKRVPNPLGQVRRQIFILAKALKEQGIDLWIGGYVYLISGRSTVRTNRILYDAKRVGEVIHNSQRQHLEEETVQRILNYLRSRQAIEE